MDRDDDELLASSDVAARLHISDDTLIGWRSRGKGPAYLKIGRSVFYRYSAVTKWILAQEREPVLRKAG